MEAGGEPGDGGVGGVASGEEVADVGERVELDWGAGLAELFVIGLGDCGEDELVFRALGEEDGNRGGEGTGRIFHEQGVPGLDVGNVFHL